MLSVNITFSYSTSSQHTLQQQPHPHYNGFTGTQLIILSRKDETVGIHNNIRPYINATENEQHYAPASCTLMQA